MDDETDAPEEELVLDETDSLEEDFTLPEDEPALEEADSLEEDDFTITEDEVDEPTSHGEDSLEEDSLDDAFSLDTAFEDDDFSFPESAPLPEETDSLEDDFSLPENEPVFEEEDTQAEDDFTLPEEADTQEEAGFDTGDALTAGAVAAGVVGAAALADNLMDDDTDLQEDTFPAFEEESTESDVLAMDDDSPFSFDSLPEFDEIPELKDENTSDMDNTDFELPDFGDTNNVISEDNLQNQNQESDPVFNSLYEESYKETERSQKKVTAPVVICVLCALICVGILGAILWLTKPSLFGWMKKENKTEIVKTEIVQKPVVQEEKADVIPETPVVEDLTAAKEDTIVVTPEPVVPEIPEPKVEEKAPEQVIYRIRWGDTLWDLADSYYKNPWLYRKIAKANNIKNPDVIISGTDIVIPPLN